MAYLYKRGAIYWVGFKDATGAPQRKSTKCRDRAKAERVLQKLERRQLSTQLDHRVPKRIERRPLICLGRPGDRPKR